MLITIYIIVTAVIFFIFKYCDILGKFDKDLSEILNKEPVERFLLDVLILYLSMTAIVLIPLCIFSYIIIKIYKDI